MLFATACSDTTYLVESDSYVIPVEDVQAPSGVDTRRGDLGDTSSPSGVDTASNPSDTSSEEPFLDPFAVPKVDDGGLTNTAWTTEELLENGELEGACDAYRDNPNDRQLMLRCGKWMFFYETFGTAGVPKRLVELLLENFPEQLGAAFSAFGMIADPYTGHTLPLGMADDGNEGLAFTCASCHMAQLPDGRYAVGAPNHQYDYGGQNLVLVAFPMAAGGEITQEILPEVKEALQPMLDVYWDDLDAQLDLWGWMMSMLGKPVPAFSKESQQAYIQWEPGTMDFFIEPLPINDTVHTVSKIAALWGIPSDAAVASSGMEHAMLGSTGNTLSLNNFVRQFAGLGGGNIEDWSPNDVAPLVAYIESLNPPTPVAGPGVDAGEKVFRTAGCIDCHSGPQGSGKRLYAFDEVDTDDALRLWMDPGGDGTGVPGVDMGDDVPTGLVKSPRLVGLWAMDKYLHNGSISTLDELLCLTPRPPSKASPLGNHGHTFGCDTLTYEEKTALIDYLMSH
ncbi:MAG: hypothetical protein VX223_16695 [Myxococcota bacterium]|nr:hypothetical protein [Myxococcota bacterium]